jgi:DnaA-homolog protein
MRIPHKQLALDIALREDATFANYVGAAKHQLDHPGQLVFVWGPPQTGRSHLLQACCQWVDDAIYLTGLDQLDAAILNRLDDRSLVCIDDVDQVLGQPAWEEGLFHLINGLKDRGKRLLLAASEPPRLLAVQLPDLRSRLLAALVVETDTLNDQQKLQVMQQRANSRGFDLKDDVGQFIMSRSARDMGSLVNVLALLEVESLRQQKKVTIPFVKQTLRL